MQGMGTIGSGIWIKFFLPYREANTSGNNLVIIWNPDFEMFGEIILKLNDNISFVIAAPLLSCMMIIMFSKQ